MIKVHPFILLFLLQFSYRQNPNIKVKLDFKSPISPDKLHFSSPNNNPDLKKIGSSFKSFSSLLINSFSNFIRKIDLFKSGIV